MNFGVMSLTVLCFGRLENRDVISKYFDYFVFYTSSFEYVLTVLKVAAINLAVI